MVARRSLVPRGRFAFQERAVRPRCRNDKAGGDVHNKVLHAHIVFLGTSEIVERLRDQPPGARLFRLIQSRMRAALPSNIWPRNGPHRLASVATMCSAGG